MLLHTRTADEMASKLREVETVISDLRCEQAVLVNELNKIHIAGQRGHRSLNEWLCAELVMHPVSASGLVFAARHLTS